MTLISFILAYDRNRVIGKGNRIPWRAPGDLRWFRRVTKGKPVIMGRRTFESIGRPLPERINIVMSANQATRADGCLIARSVEEALRLAGDAPEVMVIGGARVFEQFMERVGRLYLTEIDGTFDGDTFFPPVDLTHWREIDRREHLPEEGDPLRYTFITLDRIAQ